jgi:predicted amidophosphoribosyltransferase
MFKKKLICSNCNEKLEAGDMFCVKCGTKVEPDIPKAIKIKETKKPVREIDIEEKVIDLEKRVKGMETEFKVWIQWLSQLVARYAAEGEEEDESEQPTAG